jgi:molecular chaperone DnaK
MGSWKTSEGPRRRDATRYPLEKPLRARCTSWPNATKLFLSDVSSSGVFIATEQRAKVGDLLDLEIALPDGNVLSVRGQVVLCLDELRAAELGRHPGLGVRLAPLGPAQRARFEELLDQASRGAPMPHLAGLDAAAQNRLLARGTRPPGVDVLAGPPNLIAIDFGTTYTSVAAVSEGRRVTILPFPDGSLAIPSVVHFGGNGEVLVGHEARKRLATHPRLTVAGAKRLLGRRADDPVIAGYLERCAYPTSQDSDGMVVVEMWNEQVSIVRVCSLILAEARRAAERTLGRPVDGAVLTVPVSFSETRMEVLECAARMAGLEVKAMLDEPSAAALAHRSAPGFSGTIGVYDFGGGSFDFSIVDVSRGDYRVLATAGDTWLGGNDLDEALANTVADEYWRRYQIEVRHHAYEWQRLLLGCELVKRALSEREESLLTVPELVKLTNLRADLDFLVDRRLLLHACGDLIARSLASCDQALEAVGLRASDLSAICLSGGTSQVPGVRAALWRHFGVPIRSAVPAEYAVCLGAGVHAAQSALFGRNLPAS